MSFFMVAHVPLSSENLIALGTLEGFLFGVRPYVGLEVRLIRELL